MLRTVPHFGPAVQPHGLCDVPAGFAGYCTCITVGAPVRVSRGRRLLIEFAVCDHGAPGLAARPVAAKRRHRARAGRPAGGARDWPGTPGTGWAPPHAYAPRAPPHLADLRTAQTRSADSRQKVDLPFPYYDTFTHYYILPLMKVNV
ncbi:hypothetical protein K1T71_006565 [Dendrolimus kikuchii]|uniref:Uncharacterized protein n=1 Tax=Dendrolimus kikuchii TaxID=765133 RepID=A0ACC1D1I1_9NEOP|nr:hypothetical protein K1T71_006565 [Dendrolimus kikuchii]